MVDIQELFKKAPKDNPIILVYENGHVETRHNNVLKGKLTAYLKEFGRPVLILYPEDLKDEEMLKKFEYSTHPNNGSVAMYKKQKDNNPVIIVYVDGFVETRNNDVYEGNLQAWKTNLATGFTMRPTFILYPEQISNSHMARKFDYAIHPVKGKVLEYKKPRFVGEIDES